MGVGMCGHQGRVADRGNVPESAFIKVRQIDQNPQSIAGANQLLAEVGQTGSRVGRTGTAERYALSEGIRSASHGTKRTKPRFIQHVQKLEIRIDCFRTFEMKDSRQHAIVQALLDVVDFSAHAKAAL